MLSFYLFFLFHSTPTYWSLFLSWCSDLEEKRTASQPSLGEDSKLCSEDTLDFNGSSAVTTELNLDESLASQFSRHSERPEPFHGVPDNSPLNPAAIPPATNGMPNLLN